MGWCKYSVLQYGDPIICNSYTAPVSISTGMSLANKII